MPDYFVIKVECQTWKGVVQLKKDKQRSLSWYSRTKLEILYRIQKEN